MSGPLPPLSKAGTPIAGLQPDPRDDRDVDMLQDPHVQLLARQVGGPLHRLSAKGRAKPSQASR